MGVFTTGGSNVGSAQINDGSIVNADVNANAAIVASKLTGLPYGTLTTVTADGSSATLSSGTITAKTFLRIFVHLKGVALGGDIGIRFNGDSNTNYAAATSVGNAANTKTVTQTMIKIDTGNLTGVHQYVIDILNLSGEQKVAMVYGYETDDMIQAVGHWTTTTGQITQVDIVAAGNITTGSKMIVMGMD